MVFVSQPGHQQGPPLLVAIMGLTLSDLTLSGFAL